MAFAAMAVGVAGCSSAPPTDQAAPPVATAAKDGAVRNDAQPPHAVCPNMAPVQPFDDGCTDPVCHVAIRMDYTHLTFKGYASTGGPSNPIDGTVALAKAQAVFDANNQYGSPSVRVSPARGGLFFVFATPGDFGSFALVGADSGAVVTAGGVVWAGSGSYWLPKTWRSGSDIACGPSRAEPDETFVDRGTCDSYDGTTGAPSSDALELALRTNVAAGYASRGAFSAYLYLYTPSVGACMANVAEYIAVLTRK
jgi:hypothetical protein